MAQQIVFILAAVGVSTAALLYLLQPKMLYIPYKGIEAVPSEVGLQYEDVVFDTEDGLQIYGWYVPCADARHTLLFCHGNAGNISHRLDSLSIFNTLGMNCLIFDYRGYGQSQGKPTEKGTYLDARAAYDWLVSQKAVQPKSIVLFGRSLGAAVACQLATEIDCDGLVLESAFTSFADIGKHYYPILPVKTFARFDYDTLGKISQVHCPILVIQSPQDEIIPYSMGQKLYDAAGQPKRFLQIQGDHNEGFLESKALYLNGWTDWLGSLQ